MLPPAVDCSSLLSSFMSTSTQARLIWEMETSVGKCPHEIQLQGSLEGIFLISGWYGRSSSLWMGHCWVVVLDSEKKKLAEHHGEQGIVFHGFCTSLCLDFFRWWIVIWKCKPNQPFSQFYFSHSDLSHRTDIFFVPKQIAYPKLYVVVTS